jgi:DNA-binding NarL/FixJ family response regulator
MEMARIVLANDQVLFRDAIACALDVRPDMKIVGHASTTAEICQLVDRERPDLVLSNVGAPDLDILDVLRTFGAPEPDPKFLLISSQEHSELLIRAVRLGASGYVLWTSSLTDLIQAIAETCDGNRYFDQSLFARLAQSVPHVSSSGQTDALTPRERQVLRHIAQGLSTREIADVLAISPRTVSCHRVNLMEKLDTHKVAGLVHVAVREGIVPLQSPHAAVR